jgi:hypothetical protein
MVRRLRTGAVVSETPDPGAVLIKDQVRQFLNSQEASDYLRRKWNLSRGPRRLAELRAEGTGPRYFRAGNEVRYKSVHLDEYAIKALGEPLTSTSEEIVRRRRA